MLDDSRMFLARTLPWQAQCRWYSYPRKIRVSHDLACPIRSFSMKPPFVPD
jgi:hypothetical protein